MVTHKASDKLMVSVDREDDWMRVKKKDETELKDVESNQVGLRIQKGGSKLTRAKVAPYLGLCIPSSQH